MRKICFIGSRRDGGFAEYIVVKRNNVFALPADMPIEDGAFIEPITVGLHAFHLAQGCENKNVIIIGAGTIGLLAIQCAVALGAKSVTAIDISSEKLALAKSFGAMQTFNSREMSAPQIQGVLRELRFNQLIRDGWRPANRRTGGRDCRSSCPTGAGGHVASGSAFNICNVWQNIA